MSTLIQQYPGPDTLPVRMTETVIDHTRLHVAVIEPDGPRSGAPPLIATLGIMAELNDFEVARYRYLASLQRRPVLVLDTPGWLASQGQSTRSWSSLRRGSFAKVADDMYAALKQAAPEFLDEPVSVIGYSMGCSSGSALAWRLAKAAIPVRAVTLVEPVAIEKTDVIRLGVRNGRENLRLGRHLADNADLVDVPRSEPTVVSDPAAWTTLAHLVWALSRAEMPHVLGKLTALNHPAYTLIHGGSSRLAPAGAVTRLAEHLRKGGSPVQVVTVPKGRHGLWQSFPVVETLSPFIG
ncbi:alpha/beta fold hydrolase [Granulicoccus phenolivorans]|uniref:alpha/beta fold hydrolase n=1 Tax=Granulicoccus phenolivorans TaxID=266854 RepID=UPI0004096058|nr:alpha/beta fold hydrolase [Granulicoccus phenolivorans]